MITLKRRRDINTIRNAGYVAQRSGHSRTPPTDLGPLDSMHWIDGWNDATTESDTCPCCGQWLPEKQKA